MKYLWIAVILCAASAFGQNAYGPDFLNLHCTRTDPNSNTLFNIPPAPGLVPNVSANGNVVVYCDSSSGTLKTSFNGNAYSTLGSAAGAFGNYTLSVSGGTVSAVNNATGSVAFSGTDTAAVVNQILSATATVGARVFFKVGIYPINTFTLETATGCSNFGGSGNALAYAFGLPATTPTTSVQWLFEGEANAVFQGENPAVAINTAGVILNITSTAVASVAANSVLVGVWQRPINNCTLTDVTNISNHIYLRNLDIRFPTNQRGNTIASAPYFGASVGYKNVMADFNLTNNSIATGSAPVVGSYNSIGLASTKSGSGNIQEFDNTFVDGYNICYDFQSENMWAKDSNAVYCNFAAVIGRSAGNVFHNSRIEHFIDQENLTGIQFGNQMQGGSHVDILGYDMEFGIANWYARTAVGMSEATPNSTGGLITYTVVYQSEGIPLGNAALFTATGGGGLFTAIGSPTNIPQIPGSDSFTRAAGVSFPGAAWINNYTAGTAVNISGNAASCTTNPCFMSWNAQPANNDQFSKVTISAIDSSSSTLAGPLTNMSTNNTVKTFYSYLCSHVAAGGSSIGKNVAGVGTALSSQTSVVGCNAGDTLELRHIGTFLYGYRNGVLDTNLNPNPVSDSAITGGQPGLYLGPASSNSVSITTWSGGSLPTMHGTDSLYNNAFYATGYNTIGNCAAVGTAANPSVASCTAATAGSISCATNASTGTCTVNTTAVTVASEIFLNQRTDTTTGTRLGVTCNTTKDTNATSPQITAVTAGTSFTFQLGTITTNPECFSYRIEN